MKKHDNKKNIFIFLTIIFATFIAFFFVEIFFILNKNKFPSFGWQNNNILSKKIKKCKKMLKPKIAVFGDSMVEYYGNSNSNLVRVLQKELPIYDICNFAMAGTDITAYVSRFNATLDSELEVKYAIFYLYEGNDFQDHFYPENSIKYKETLNYDPKKTKDRNLGLFRNFVKSTYTINIFYRYVFKRFFPFEPINEEYIIDFYNDYKLSSNVNLENALERFNNTPQKNIDLFTQGIFNRSLYLTALLRPDYYNEIHSPSNKEFLRQKKVAFHHINYLKNKCKKHNIGCFFFIIPEENFVSRESQKLYHDFYRFEKINVFGLSKIADSLISNYEYIFYPKDILNGEDYLELDGHLKKSGNVKIAKFTKNILETIISIKSQ